MIDLTQLRLAICTDTYPPQINGVARTLARLVEAVRQRGGTAQVFTVADPEAVDADDIIRFSSRPFWAYPQLQVAFPGARAMTSALRTFEPTVVHVATEFGVGLAGRAAARRMSLPLVSSYHTNFAAYAAHYQLGFLATPGWQYLRWFHNGAIRTFCPTEAIRSDLRQRGIRRSRVWSRGVDSDRFSPVHRSSELREKIGASDDSVVISYIGRLAPEKGIPLALEAMRLTALARPGRVRFLIGGDGPIEGALRERAPSAATFLGRLEGAALSAAFASSDLFVFPSTTDTFGNVMLEAMASGVPVVGADVPPTREVLGTDGWLIEPGNAPAMARQLIHLVDHPDELALMKRRARERAMQQSWDKIWDRLGSEYLALQARPAHPQSILHTLPST